MAGPFGELRIIAKGLFRDGPAIAGQRREIVAEPAREMECVLLGRLLGSDEKFAIDLPADFDTAEKIGLGPGHGIEPRRLECRAGAEDIGIGMKCDQGAAPVLGGAELCKFSLWLAAGVVLAPECPVAGDLDPEPVGERVDHGNADAMQPA